jgi:hypothetical protein
MSESRSSCCVNGSEMRLPWLVGWLTRKTQFLCLPCALERLLSSEYNFFLFHSQEMKGAIVVVYARDKRICQACQRRVVSMLLRLPMEMHY